jgi:hypothetical protein
MRTRVFFSALLLLQFAGGCGGGIEPAVRSDFGRYRESQRVIGDSYLRDLQAANDRFLRVRLEGDLLSAAGDIGKVRSALDRSDAVRGVHRGTYTRIRRTLTAMEEYANGIELVLGKLERRRRVEDDLSEEARKLLEQAIKKAATGQ